MTEFRAVPYFALEVIKEPTYRPFKNAEEFKPYRDEWFVSKCDNSQSSSVKAPKLQQPWGDSVERSHQKR